MQPTNRLLIRLPLTLPLLLLVAAVLAACAPAASPARGPVGEQVQRGIETGSEEFDHSRFDALLSASVRDGLVDYAVFQQRRAELDEYLATLAAADLASLERDHLMALLLNAYNAYTIASILDHWGVSSIREIDGVWDRATHDVGGNQVTLDTLEHNLLRPYFQDPRIHVAVNCASMSCAPLPTWAFDGDQLEQQLEQWTHAFFADPRYLTREGEALRVSKLLDWYGEDFTAEGWRPRAETLAGFIQRYAPAEIAAWLEERRSSGDEVEIRFFDYDWSLNQAP
ncbi:MAG: DUF547 domain-containing protein [Acidobacteria bacterium]|nr:MAG: DUF547 domain-containing protein [Acidobacteriota bacterium]REJ99437.1 MAG: DUF547 domain-containing protein [Acidobacteriota bacterium]